VEATAAGSFGKGFELQDIENFLEPQAGARGVAEFSRLRIHVETNPIGFAQGRGAAPGYVNGDATEICQRKLSRKGAADDVICGFSGFACVGDLLGGRAGRHVGRGFFLVETAAAHAIWATLEREDAIVYVWLKLGKNGGVKLDELELGVAFVGPENFRGIGNGDRKSFGGGRICWRVFSGFRGRSVRRLGVFCGR
jgi:hypothetical protein